jgi:chromosomal replication initiation ATPase DnaA
MNEKSRQLVLDLPLRQALGRDDFLVTSSNSAAVELIDQWPRWPSYGAIIMGPPGSGKTHLVEVWRQLSGAALCPAGAMTIEAVPDLLKGGVLAVEDAAAGEVQERALFHALNLAKQQGNQILVTSQTSPAQWQLKIPDLLSRLNALPVVSILSPDDALLRGVLVKLFADRQIAVDESMISYILLRIPRSLDAARALVGEIDRQALVERAEVTRPFVARVMASFTNPSLFVTD